MFEILLIISTLLCSLVAGFLFAFAVVAMPGISRLGDREFLKAFQEIDGIIQRNNPLFYLMWVGSIILLITSAAFGIGLLGGGTELWLLLTATLIYIAGVQLPTMIVNVPLNNGLQAYDIDALDASELSAARTNFEPRWNRWNIIRTLVSILVSILLLVLLVRW
ncbi:MAG: DUF1772 domain-containing protein [Rhodothermales bacterium]|nr:DUF1772 domain-containing protein [Rhodothermales bacterium]